MALDAALVGSRYLCKRWDQHCKSFIKKLEVPEVYHLKFTVHAELTLLMAKVRGDINDVAHYIGVSKLSCIMCSNYILAFNMVTEENIATKGSHGKAYPGWCWPSFPSRDEELRPIFLELIREQLRRDFEADTDIQPRRLSDSSVGPDSPGIGSKKTRDQVRDLINAAVSTVLPAK